MLATMRGAAIKPEMKPNQHTALFHWDETQQYGSVQFCLWAGQVPASSILVLIMETSTSDLIIYLSGRGVSTSGDLPLSQAETSACDLFQPSFYTSSTWSAKPNFISALNNLDNVSLKKRQKLTCSILQQLLAEKQKQAAGVLGCCLKSFLTICKEMSFKIFLNGWKLETAESVPLYFSIPVV